MDVVADANVIISALLKDSATRRLLLISDIVAYSPPYLIEELDEKSGEILSKAGIGEKSMERLKEGLLLSVRMVPKPEFEAFLGRAREISADADDIPYFALAMKLGCPVWSNDKSMKRQSSVKVLSTTELLELL